MATKRTAAPEATTAGDQAAEATQTEDSAQSETYRYPDGSAVVGRPPWPEKSPLERARDVAEGKAEA